MKNVLLFSIFFCAITVPVFGDLTQTDLDKIRLIIKDEIKKEISESETRMKEYINIKIDSGEKRLNMLFGVVIALIAIVGIPQIIVAWRSSKYKELENKIEYLTQEIQTLKQQRIVSS
ncbi:hypothetical protein C6501_02930 [Candidatus Poribacteria bacterium]|nr:MAG: hypothetical protein C6501_02930 [Candidatus Poribacteria bacterium]